MDNNSSSGLYIVTLLNEDGIGVNANDPRYAATCLRVDRRNCKFGKAKNLAARAKNYQKVFGSENVVFRPIVHVAPDHIAEAERVALRELWRWRVRHTNGTLHEWLVDIAASDVETIVIDALTRAGVEFRGRITVEDG